LITVDEKNFEIDLFVGGDMKFVLILLGLDGSTGDFACPWCKIHKQDRHDVTKEWNFYHSAEFFRSTQEISFLRRISVILSMRCNSSGIKWSKDTFNKGLCLTPNLFFERPANSEIS
jgi:hypothetical protein